MKKKSLFTIALLSTLLFSCHETTESTSASTQPPISESTTPDSSPVSDAIASETNGESESESTENRQDVYAEMWGKNVADLMKKHLNYVIPYIDIGKPQATFVSKNNDYYLEVTGLKGTLDYATDEEWMTVFSQYLIEDEWTILEGGSIQAGFTATKAEKNLRIVLTDIEDISCTLKCYYDEPYDENYAGVAWPDDVQEAIDQALDSHSLPYVYLGSKAPAIASSSSYDLEIVGGKWDERILNVKNIFVGDNWSVTDLESTTQFFKAQKTFEDGCKLEATLFKSATDTSARAILGVNITHGYHLEESNGVWDNYVQEAMNETFGLLAPYFYLGDNTLTVESTTRATCTVKLSGGDYDADVLDSIKTQLEGISGYTWTTSFSTHSSYRSLIASGTNITTDDTFEIEVQRNSDGRFLAIIEYFEGYQPTKATGWSDEIVSQFNTNCDSHQIPYTYIGTKGNVAFVNNTTTKGGTLVITGGKWDDRILTAASEAYSTSEWEITLNDTDSDKFTATGKMSDGCSFSSVEIFASSTGHVCMYVYFVPKMTTTETEWSATIQNYITNDLHGHSFPFVYLNKDNAYGSFSSSSMTLVITGGYVRSEVYDNFNAAYTADNWEITESEKTFGNETTQRKVLVAKKTFDDECKLEVTLTPSVSQTGPDTYSQAQFRLEVKYTSPYDTTKATDWTNETKQLMQDNFNTIFPYVYLGSDDPEAKVTINTRNLSLTGGSWSDFAYAHFEDVIERENANLTDGEKWTLTEYTDNKIKYLYARRVETSSRETRMFFGPSSTSATAKVSLNIYCYEPAVYTSNTAWQNDIKEALLRIMPEERLLPYFDVGTSKLKKTVEGNSLRLMGNSADYVNGWSNQYIDNAAQVLENNGYEVEVAEHSRQNKQTSGLIATKEYDDGARTIVQYTLNNIAITYFPAYNLKETGAWSSEIQAKMQEMLNGNILPYCYLGEGELDVGLWTSDSNATISTYAFSEEMFTDIKDAFLKDTEREWSASYDYTGKNGKTLIMSCADPLDPEHHITVTFYKKVTDNYYQYLEEGILTFKYN